MLPLGSPADGKADSAFSRKRSKKLLRVYVEPIVMAEAEMDKGFSNTNAQGPRGPQQGFPGLWSPKRYILIPLRETFVFFVPACLRG
jgi:hypothetical protein